MVEYLLISLGILAVFVVAGIAASAIIDFDKIWGGWE